MFALAILPGRITLALGQSQLGRSPIEFVIAGTLRDLSDVALPVGLVLLLTLAMALVVRRAAWRRSFYIALSIAGILLWLTSSSTAEYKMQRGVDATWLDLQLGSRNLSVGETFIGFVMLRRHWLPSLFAIAAVTLVLVAARRRRSTIERALPALAGFAATIGLGYAAALVPLDPNVRIFRTIGDRHVVGEPFVSLFRGLGRSQENVRLGMKTLLETARFPPSELGGEALLGLPLRTSPDCATHPLARALPIAGVEPPLPGAGGHRPLDPSAARVLALLDQLGDELYRDRARPIDVWQLMLESFRADDIHALSTAAPRELAPFTNTLYEEAARGGSSGNAVIALQHMWQAGSRSSQGLSAYMCGLGMLPYGLSITRDFGPLPIRCLTDVLADSGFESTFFYGGPPSFDEMDSFFREHEVRDIVGRQQLPADSPTSEGGVSDRALYARAAERAKGRAGDRARYHLLMSASNHVPYRRPDDLPPEITARVKRLTAIPGYAGTSDDDARLATFAYADLAVSELFAHLERDLDRTLFVLGADHATGDPFVWPPTPDWSRQAAHAQIPFTIVLPERLVAASAHPERIRAIVRELDRALDDHVWSQNDAPLFLLTILLHSPGGRALPQDRRWHTLGGERTSPFFAAPKSEVTVIGIDCVAEFFGTDDSGRGLLPPETASFVRDASEIYTSSPSLRPVAATFSRFLNGYAAKCPGR